MSFVLAVLGILAATAIVFFAAWSCSMSFRAGVREWSFWWLNMAVLVIPAGIVGVLWAWLQFKGWL